MGLGACTPVGMRTGAVTILGERMGLVTVVVVLGVGMEILMGMEGIDVAMGIAWLLLGGMGVQGVRLERGNEG